VIATQTLEGENYVLWQQVYRFLLKCVRKLEAGQKILSDISYLADGFQTYHVPAPTFDCSPAASDQSIAEMLQATEPQAAPNFESVPHAFTNPGGFIAMAAGMSDPTNGPYHEWLQEKASEIMENFRPVPKQKPKPSKPVKSPRCQASGKEFLDPAVQLALYRHRSLRLIYATAAALAKSKASGMSEAESWNKHMLCVIDAARAHTEYQVLENIQETLQSIPPEYQNLKPVLTRLMSLYALSTIMNPHSAAAITWAEDGHLSYSQLNDIREVVHDLLGELYFEAIALTDAWDFTDASLCSAIGCYDGNVYERIMSWTRQLPINVKAKENGGVHAKGWEETIKPFLMEGKVRAKL
jgi:hypothetical protein